MKQIEKSEYIKTEPNKNFEEEVHLDHFNYIAGKDTVKPPEVDEGKLKVGDFFEMSKVFFWEKQERMKMNFFHFAFLSRNRSRGKRNQ